jgi:hypothetical protein
MGDGHRDLPPRELLSGDQRPGDREISDPDTHQVVPDGETGELVLTTFGKTAVPMNGYRPSDPPPIIFES